MKNPELFHKTVGILVKAYFENTLEHSNCYACAVQNIVAGNMGYCIVPKPKYHKLRDCWNVNVVITGIEYDETLTAGLGFESAASATLCSNQLNELESTGYSYQELTNVEIAFEGVSEFRCRDKNEYVFNGLMAVIDCLMLIHEATTEEATAAKELFTTA